MKFELIKNIDILNTHLWQDKIFLTFDTDWCSDEVLSYTLDIIEKYDIKATFFVTHETKILKRMKANSNIELGIHPNFNFLLNGDFRQGKSIDEVIEYYLKFVPNAKSVRSHSMTQNSHILDSFDKFGLIYDCNTFIPYSSQIVVAPYKHWTKNLIKVPYFWEDDVHYTYKWAWDIENFISYNGIKVFDFHPVHVFLNTNNVDTYHASKDSLGNFNALKKYINSDFYATRNFLLDLIKQGKE